MCGSVRNNHRLFVSDNDWLRRAWLWFRDAVQFDYSIKFINGIHCPTRILTSADDAVLYSAEDVFDRLIPLLRLGSLKRGLAFERWVRRLQPVECFLLVGEHFAGMDRDGHQSRGRRKICDFRLAQRRRHCLPIFTITGSAPVSPREFPGRALVQIGYRSS